MNLSIIVTSYKNPDLLKVCIDSIKSSLGLENYEIISADSCTEEKTALMMREDYPEIIFLPFSENTGFQFLVKKAFEKSSGKYILILNGDIIVKKDSIRKLLDFLKSHPQAGLIGPKLLNFNETLQHTCYRFYSPLTVIYRRTFLGKLPFGKKHLDKFLMKDYAHNTTREVDWLMGSALMTSREAIETVGHMDDRFRMYFEDVDWCRRFWENKLKVIYFPEAEMYHYHGKGSANKSALQSLISNRLTWLHILSGLKYFLKYFRKPLPQHN